MKISYIIPHSNRIDLFTYNLNTLLCQTSKNFEIIIVDNSTDENWILLKSVIESFRGKGLDIKSFRVDQAKCVFSHDISLFEGKYNPALNQNVGAQKATGEILIFTSPEVINATGNVEYISKIFSDLKSKFVLGWVREQYKEKILRSDLSESDIKSLIPFLEGATCIKEDWKPFGYFLGSILKKDFIKIGGIEEKFMSGIAYDDTLFAHMLKQNNVPVIFDENIAGIHLYHDRSYQRLDSNPNPFIYKNFISKNDRVSNIGHDWGSDQTIIEQF